MLIEHELNSQTSGFKGDMHKMASIPPIVIGDVARRYEEKMVIQTTNPLAVFAIENIYYLN